MLIPKGTMLDGLPIRFAEDYDTENPKVTASHGCGLETTEGHPVSVMTDEIWSAVFVTALRLRKTEEEQS